MKKFEQFLSPGIEGFLGSQGDNHVFRLRSKSLNSQDKPSEKARKERERNDLQEKTSKNWPKIRQILDPNKILHPHQTSQKEQSAYETILKQQEAHEAILDEPQESRNHLTIPSQSLQMKNYQTPPTIVLEHQLSMISEDEDPEDEGSRSFRSRSKSLNNQERPTAKTRNDDLLGPPSDKLTEPQPSNLNRRHSLCSLTPPATIITKDMKGRKRLTSIKAYENLFAKFFQLTKCYDLCPTSGKMVILDDRMLLSSAFLALIENTIRAAPLWNSSQQQFVGMLTISDFIKMLIRNYDNPNLQVEEEIQNQRCEDWVRTLKREGKLISLSPEDSTYTAIEKLLVNKIHRLPIIDPATGIVFKIITHNIILKQLHRSLKELPHIPFLQESILDLGIGTHKEIVTAKEDTTVIEALHIFENNRVSGIPIVDPSGQLVDIYCKFDVINIAAKKQYNNLDITLKEATEYRTEWFRGVYKCTPDDSLLTVMNRFARTEVHRLVIVREDETVCGIVSLSDILSYLIQRHKAEQEDEKKQERDEQIKNLCDAFKATLEENGFSIDDAIIELKK